VSVHNVEWTIDCIIDISNFISNVNKNEKGVNNRIACKAVGAEPKLVNNNKDS